MIIIIVPPSQNSRENLLFKRLQISSWLFRSSTIFHLLVKHNMKNISYSQTKLPIALSDFVNIKNSLVINEKIKWLGMK